VPDHVRHAGQRQGLPHGAAVAAEHDQVTAVRGAEEPIAVEPEAVRPRARNIERVDDLQP
jgi:hypothetical protein